MRKRIIIATLTALVLGLLDWSIDAKLAAMGGYPLAAAIAASIVVSRTLIGTVVGISALKIFPWWAHGMIIGAILSLPAALANLAWGYPWGLIFGAKVIVLGLVYGILVELVTSVFFDAPMVGKKSI